MPKGTPGKTLVTRPCPECGKEFSVPKGQERNKQYCTAECGRANKTRNQHRPDTRSCAHCGAEFTVLLSSKQKTCSTKCAGLYKRRQVVRKCRICEKAFSVFQASKVMCCSAECGLISAKHPRVKRTPVACATCGVVMLVTEARAKTAKYCSRTCMFKNPERNAAIGTRCSGENNWNYKGSLRDAVSASGKSYKRSSPESELARYAKRRAAKRKANVAWANKEAIEAIYAKAQRFSAETGESFHVDHIVPLTNDRVCGLHWEGNLQILHGFDNLSKGNKVWPDMP